MSGRPVRENKQKPRHLREDFVTLDMGRPPKKTPVNNEHDKVEDMTQAGKICCIKYATTVERLPLWIDAIERKYPGDDSVTQGLNSGDGKQVKIYVAPYANTVIELFYTTGLIVIKGKHPAFIKWADEVYPLIRSTIPENPLMQGDCISEDNPVNSKHAVESNMQTGMDNNETGKTEADKTDKSEADKIHAESPQTVSELNLDTSQTDPKVLEEPAPSNIELNTKHAISPRPRDSNGTENRSGSPVFDFSARMEYFRTLGTPKDSPRILPKTPIQIAKQDISWIKETLQTLESCVKCIPEIKAKVDVTQRLAEENRDALDRKIIRAHSEVNETQFKIQRMEIEHLKKEADWKIEKTQLRDRVDSLLVDLDKAEQRIELLNTELKERGDKIDSLIVDLSKAHGDSKQSVDHGLSPDILKKKDEEINSLKLQLKEVQDKLVSERIASQGPPSDEGSSSEDSETGPQFVEVKGAANVLSMMNKKSNHLDMLLGNM